LSSSQLEAVMAYVKSSTPDTIRNNHKLIHEKTAIQPVLAMAGPDYLDEPDDVANYLAFVSIGVFDHLIVSRNANQYGLMLKRHFKISDSMAESLGAQINTKTAWSDRSWEQVFTDMLNTLLPGSWEKSGKLNGDPDFLREVLMCGNIINDLARQNSYTELSYMASIALGQSGSWDAEKGTLSDGSSKYSDLLSTLGAAQRRRLSETVNSIASGDVDEEEFTDYTTDDDGGTELPSAELVQEGRKVRATAAKALTLGKAIARGTVGKQIAIGTTAVKAAASLANRIAQKRKDRISDKM